MPDEPKHGDLRIYFNPAVPGVTFYRDVNSVREAVQALNTLREFSAFYAEAHFMPSAGSVDGVEIYDTVAGGGLEWQEWESADGLDAFQAVAEQDETAAHRGDGQQV